MSKVNKRMGHVFNEMVVKPGRDIDSAELHFIGGGVSATFFCAQQAHHAAHAINNHDRMTDEIATLKQDRDSAISKMSKSWRHNASDYPNLLSEFVDMANRQFDEIAELREMLKVVVDDVDCYGELTVYNFKKAKDMLTRNK